jgi:tRNA-2-methylthio-N6-dimethylallyladenosine synthase
MGRQYSVAAYLELVERLRAAIPGIALTTDVIVGFCGETEAQFEATLRLLERVRFDQVFAAAYSPRPGTPATRLADDVPAEVKRRRLNGLLAAQEAIGRERNEAWVGRAVEVLLDTVSGPRAHEHETPGGEQERGDPHAGTAALSGRTRGNKLVHVIGDPRLVGREIVVRIRHAGAYALRGTVTEDQPTVVR